MTKNKSTHFELELPKQRREDTSRVVVTNKNYFLHIFLFFKI